MPKQIKNSRRSMAGDTPAEGAQNAVRQAWVTPILYRMNAVAAENGIDPIVPDGPLSFGS